MQQKLAINTPGDQYEREADSVAEGVMRMPESGVGPGTAISIGSLGVQCKCSCDEEKQLQRKRGASTDSGQTATPPTVHEVLRSPGLPLDGATRAFMEPRFGYDFSAVRVHSGAVAEQSARDVNARAYTVGHNIVFGPNRLTPETHEGRKLIAHELTHVVQQAGGGKPHQQMPGSQPVQRFLGGPRLQRFGEPENVPEMTYISSVDPSGGDARKDAFLKEATNYHTNWGLKIKSVKSMEELVTDLSKAAGPVNRIRIVSHAWENRLFLGLFDGDSPGIDLKALKAIGESEVALLTELVGPVSGVTNVDANMILSAVRDANPDVIRPFHLDSGHALPKPINEFVVRAATLWMLVKGTGDAALKGPMRTAIESILRELRHRLARPAPDGAGVTETQAKALQDAIVALEPDPATPLKFDTTKETVAPIKTANTAFAAGFSDKLKKARGRFTDSSWIDIRGCKVGEQPAYMQAISAFFGGSAAKPHVSAPNWVQLFRALTYKELDDGDIASTAAATGVSDALDHWAAVTGVDAKMAGLDTAARLKVYLDEALVLPVRPAAKADNLRLYVKKSLKGKAFDKWLASQWKPDAPGLKALKVAGLTSVDSRWVIGVSDKLTEDGVLIVAPDPDYKTHIKEI
jgi:hypothetical protein